MPRKVCAVLVRVDAPRVEILSDFNPTLRNLQSIVGGNIEPFPLLVYPNGREITAWVNEESLLINLKPNFAVVNQANNQLLTILHGDVIITATTPRGSTTGLNKDELDFVVRNMNFNRKLLSPVFCDKVFVTPLRV